MGREDESSFIDAIRKLYVYIEEIEHKFKAKMYITHSPIIAPKN